MTVAAPTREPREKMLRITMNAVNRPLIEHNYNKELRLYALPVRSDVG